MPPRVTRASTRLTAHNSPVPKPGANGDPPPLAAGKKKRVSEAHHSSNSKRPKKQASDTDEETDGEVVTSAAHIPSGQDGKEAPKPLPKRDKSVKQEVEGPKNGKAIDEEEEEEKEDVEISVKKKTTRKQKTKAERTEEEMTPLAPRTSGLGMHIGAHVSAAKGIYNAVTNSTHIGGNAFALFLKSQRRWENPPLQADHRDQFKKLCSEQGYDASKYVLPHGSYLVNLAQEDPDKAKQAYTSFVDDLRRCEELGIQLYNFHPGSTNKTTLDSSLSRLAKALISALDDTKTVIPVLETCCGHGTTIGGPLSHFRDLLALIPETYHSRIGICLDTCHSFAAGYDLRTPETWNAFMREFDETIGLRFLRAFHLNDSKTPLGSRRDLHANIGTGFLGLRAFHSVMNDKRLEGMPMILETPIDRPAPTTVKKESQKEEVVLSQEEQSNDEDDEPSKKGKKKTTKKQSVKTTKTATRPAKPVLVEDKSVWAREIKLLESLIGMDVESAEFRALEAELAEDGEAEREKQQALFDKKKEKEGKQKDIRNMFGAEGKDKKTGVKGRKKKVEAESDEEQSA